jgi:hypothetical protein
MIRSKSVVVVLRKAVFHSVFKVVEAVVGFEELEQTVHSDRSDGVKAGTVLDYFLKVLL